MLSMNIDFPLQEIDISDTPEEEVLLVSDLPINRQIKFSFILPIFFFIVFILVSIFLPSAEFTQSIDDNLTKSSQFSVWNTVSQMAPIYKYIKLKFDIKGPNSDLKLNFSGNVDIKIYENNILLHNFDYNISTHSISEPIYLFTSQLIDFDKIVTAFNFTTSKELEGNFFSSITTTTMSTICSLFISFIRIQFSLFLFFSLFGSTNFIFDIDSSLNKNEKNDKAKKAPKTIEQKITFFLILSAFFYADPLDVINLNYPSKFSRTITIFLRDFFYSYLVFYINAIFSYFTRDPLENQLISLLFPYLYMAVSLILFWINDADIYLQNEAKVLPLSDSSSSLLLDSLPDFPTLENFSNLHFLFYIFLFVSIIIQIVISGINVRKNRIEQTQRWIFYTSTSLSLLLLISVYIFLKIFFVSLIEQTIFDQVYVLVVSLCYVMIMEFGHEETNIEKKDLYIMHDEDNKRINGDIGGSINDHSLEVDQDLEKLNEKKNKSVSENMNSQKDVSKNELEKPPEIQVMPVEIPSNQADNQN